jgi:hypothetical protein
MVKQKKRGGVWVTSPQVKGFKSHHHPPPAPLWKNMRAVYESVALNRNKLGFLASRLMD